MLLDSLDLCQAWLLMWRVVTWTFCITGICTSCDLWFRWQFISLWFIIFFRLQVGVFRLGGRKGLRGTLPWEAYFPSNIEDIVSSVAEAGLLFLEETRRQTFLNQKNRPLLSACGCDVLVLTEGQAWSRPQKKSWKVWLFLLLCPTSNHQEGMLIKPGKASSLSRWCGWYCVFNYCFGCCRWGFPVSLVVPLRVNPIQMSV